MLTKLHYVFEEIVASSTIQWIHSTVSNRARYMLKNEIPIFR